MGEKQLDQNIDIVLELDWQGAQQIKQCYPEAITIFVLPPSKEALRKRLNKRNLDSEIEIKNRLAQSKNEIINGSSFDRLIVNDNFESALNDLILIINHEQEIPKERQEIAKTCLNLLLDQ